MKRIEKEINTRFINMIMIVLVALIILITFIPSRTNAFIFLAVIILSTFKEPLIAYIGWIIGYTYFHNLTQATGILGYFILSPLILHGVIIQRTKGVKYRIPIPIVLFSGAIIITATVSLLFSRNPSENIIALGMLFVAIFIMTSIISTIRNNPEALRIINQGFIITVIAIFFATVITGDFIGAGRISIGDSIRKIANVAGPTIIILYIELILSSKKEKKTILNWELPTWIIIVLFILSIVILLSTVSRGAYMAVAISMLSIFIMNMFLKKQKSKLINKIVLYPLIISLMWWAFEFVKDNIARNYMNRVNINDFGSNARWEIWKNALVQMKGYEYVIGSGPNSFKQLTYLSGRESYAHSVFLDTFVTLGFIGSTILISFMLYTLIKCINNKNVYALGLLVLTMFLYSTHGNLTGSMDFWALLGIIYGSLGINELESTT